ncbi:hypothetical protein ACP70R_019125 [Stipagrostis hirtigluma subsp. patula]
MGNSCITGFARPRLGKTHDPAFKWKVHGFSALLERGAISANSAHFHCCGYKCDVISSHHLRYLEVAPMHKNSGDGISYVAICLSLSRSSFKPDYFINAVFELSMHNHSNGTYCGRKARYSFHVKKTHSEKICLIPLDELLKSSEFLVDDCCAFGVRILKADVSSPKGMPSAIVIPEKPISVQNLFLQKKGFIKGNYTWTIYNFLDLKLPVRSPTFEVGEHKWNIRVHPLGNEYSTNSVSLFLHLHDLKNLPDPDSGVKIELTVSILDQNHGKHFTITGRFVFASAAKVGWGWSNFIPLETLNDPSRAYLAGSSYILKADITIIGSSNDG